MRVLHLVSGLMDGGGQQVALDLAAGLRRLAGIEADLGLLGCASERLGAAAAFVVDYHGNYASPGALAAAARRLRRVLAGRRYDLVHSHGWDADAIARWALRPTGQRQVAHLHVTPAWVRSGAFRHRVRQALTRRMLGAGPVSVIAVSEAVRRHWAGAFPDTAERIRVVHNGVDVERFRPAADGERQDRAGGAAPLVLGTACRLAPQKGLATLIEALPRVIGAAGRPLRLDIAGEGPQRAELEARAAALGLQQHVRFLGAQPDMPVFYRSLDLFVLPSESEGLPLAVLEAMASGLPVVASAVGGTAEAVRDRRDGRIVPPRCREALVAALADLIADDAQRRAMGAQACRRARQAFTLDRQIDRVAAHYGELCGGAGQTGEPLAA